MDVAEITASRLTRPAATGDGRRAHSPTSERISMSTTNLTRGGSTRTDSSLPDVALLLLRLVVGVTFLLHGIQKLDDLTGIEQFFASLGIPAPELMSPLVAVTETAGGLLLIAGLATPIVGAALATDMLVAFLTAHIGNGFFVEDGGGELVLLLGSTSIAVALAGAGRFSTDAAFGLMTGVARLAARAWSRLERT
jgi:putative oxidoreductase